MEAYQGKHISIGIGSSSMLDPYEAAKRAAEKSVIGFDKPRTFSIVYARADADPREVARGISEIFGTRDWIGASADRQFSSTEKYSDDTTVSVVSLQTEYMHFGIGVARNYRKNPRKAGINAAMNAVKTIRSDKYIDSYVQFTRHKKQDYSTIVKHPPYLLLAFASGAEFVKRKPVSGEEVDFLRGIQEYLGPHIPVFGGGAGSDFEDYLYRNQGSNYLLANGEVLKNTGIAVFAISNLYFTTTVKHSYKPTERFAAVTKLDKTGHEILELNGNEPVEEYCKLIGVSKSEYLKDPFTYSLKNPLGIITLDGSTYVKEALPNANNKTFHSTYKLMKNYVLNIMEYDDKSHYNTMQEAINEARTIDKHISLALFCNCSTRRLLEGKDTEKIIESFKKNKIPFFGFYAFSEIGNTKTSSAQVHGETITSLIIYDKLLVD